MSDPRADAHASVFDPEADKPREECGLFGVFGPGEAANFAALGLHALQHRGQEAAGIVTYEPGPGFSEVKRLGYVRDNFTSAKVMAELPGTMAVGHVRYSTSGEKGHTRYATCSRSTPISRPAASRSRTTAISSTRSR